MTWTALSAAGNTFALVDGFVDGLPDDPAALAREVCAGGALDGLILVLPPSAGGDCRMVIHNADGSRAETCGNGLRCVAKLAVERGHVARRPFVIETDVGPRSAQVTLAGGRVVRATIEMGRPRILARAERLALAGRELSLTLVDMGNPHCVLFVDDERRAPVETLGPALERHARFAQGTNVGFLAQRDGAAYLRVWERGVGETRACGSGACAAAWAAVDAGRAEFPLSLAMPGGVLIVDSDGAGGVTLAGPVEPHAGSPR